MTSPRFSVIIPTLNEEKFLPHLLDSLVDQSVKEFEVIVVDGSSKDRTVAIAQGYKRKLTLSVVVSKQANLPFQRNLGAQKANASWLVFVDADSVLLPYFIERIDRFIADQNPQVFTTWFRPDSEVTNDALFTLMSVMTIEGSLLFKRPNVTPGPLTVIEKATFESVGGYDEDHAFHEDLDLGLRLYQRKARYAFLRETLYIWSLRRFRNEGTMKVIQQHARSVLSIIFFRRPMKSKSGYIMGGHLYGKSKKPKSVLAQYERKFKKMMKELFE